MKSLVLAALFVMSSSAFAEYVRIAECQGRTQANVGARGVLFVDKAADTNGMVMVTVANRGDYLSKTKVNWNGAGGFPRFYDNDFDLDIVINDRDPSQDDVLVGDDYIQELVCEYAP